MKRMIGRLILKEDLWVWCRAKNRSKEVKRRRIKERKVEYTYRNTLVDLTRTRRMLKWKTKKGLEWWWGWRAAS